MSVGRHSGGVHWWVGLGGRVSGNLMGGWVVIMVDGESFAKSILLPSVGKRQLHIYTALESDASKSSTKGSDSAGMDGMNGW